jgi:hypothetical protein
LYFYSEQRLFVAMQVSLCLHGTRIYFPRHRKQNKKPTTRVSFLMWELLGRRVASATTSSLQDRIRCPARAVLAAGHPGQPTRLHAHCYSRASSSAARIPAYPAPAPDTDSISQPPSKKQKRHHKGVVKVGIGLAGRTFACKRMPFRATNSTQVLFV